MKNSVIRALLLLLLLAPAVWAGKEEKEAKKLDKELKKVSLTAAVMDGRRVVNRVMAEQLGVSRKLLVEERKRTGLAYGELFGAHEVARLAGVPFSEVAKELDEGQGVAELSAQRQVELKAILADAKKLNKKIDGELDRIANGNEDEDAEDAADSYDPGNDSLDADTSGFSPSQIAQANDRVHQRGAQSSPGGPSGAGRGAAGGSGSNRGSTGAGPGSGPRRGRP